MADVINDPETIGFDGRYVDDSFCAGAADYDYTMLVRYMKEHNKVFGDLTSDELKLFLINK